MKICFITPEFYPFLGGTANATFGFSRELVKKGYNVCVITKHIRGAKKIGDINGIKIFRVNCSNTRFFGDVEFIIKSILVARKIKADVFYGQMILPSGLASLTACWLYGGRCAVHARGADVNFGFKKWYLWPFNYFSLRFNDFVFALSEDHKMLINKFLKQKKATVLTNGVDIRFNITQTKAKRLVKFRDGFNVTFIGRLVKEKGVIVLVKAIENLKGVFLHIAGEGGERAKLEEYTREHKIKNVKFYGKLGRDKTFLLIKASDCCAFPLFVAAGVNNAVLEAMLLGVPVIGTNTGFFKEFNNKESILLTKYGDIYDLKEAIIRLKKDNQLREKIAKNAYRLVKEKYNWDIITKRFLELLDAKL